MTADARKTAASPENTTAELLTAWYGDKRATGSARPAVPERAAALLAPGTMVAGRYRVEYALGAGGFASVMAARDLRQRRWVALKLYPLNAGVMAIDEARLQGTVQHPNIMPLYESGEDALAGVAFLAMPLYSGCDLQEMLETYGPLSFRMALACLDQLCSAVEYLWLRRGVPHGDIKPANIWVTGSGAALLMDFNVPGQLARHPERRIGTPGFTAPEVFQDRADERSDVFSLGCVLYTCLAGAPPFAADGDARAGRYIPIRRARTDIRPTLAAVVERALAPDPAARFPTARALRTALRGHRFAAPGWWWSLPWDMLAVIAGWAWALLRGGYRLLWRFLRHAWRRPGQAAIEAAFLVLLGWFLWWRARVYWTQYRAYIFITLIACGVAAMAIAMLRRRRRRW